MLGVMASVKSGVGLAPLPMVLGGSEDGLEAVLAPGSGNRSRLYLCTHADLRRTARVLAFCDFIAAEVARFRSYLMGDIRTVDRPFGCVRGNVECIERGVEAQHRHGA